MYKVIFTKKAEKELEKLATKDTRNLITRLTDFTYPFPQRYDIKKMIKAKDFYRLRMGKVRVLLEVDFAKKEIWIQKVGYRGGVYKG